MLLQKISYRRNHGGKGKKWTSKKQNIYEGEEHRIIRWKKDSIYNELNSRNLQECSFKQTLVTYNISVSFSIFPMRIHSCFSFVFFGQFLDTPWKGNPSILSRCTSSNQRSHLQINVKTESNSWPPKQGFDISKISKLL